MNFLAPFLIAPFLYLSVARNVPTPILVVCAVSVVVSGLILLAHRMHVDAVVRRTQKGHTK